MKKSIFSAFVLWFILPYSIDAQSTFNQVHTLFQTKCTPTCHSGSSPSGNLDLSGTAAEVYSRLIHATPVNPVAAGKGYKLVDPGYPFRSFLMKKVNHGLDPQNELTANEGSTMPDNAITLSNEEKELIRQWIIWGAKDTGVAFNAHLIHDYYNGPGIKEIQAPMTPAQEGKEGYQVKFGPVFLQPQGEFEFFQVYNPQLQVGKEITTMES